MGAFRVAERALEHPRVQLPKRIAGGYDPEVIGPAPNAGIEHAKDYSYLRPQTLAPEGAELLPDFLDRVFTGSDT